MLHAVIWHRSDDEIVALRPHLNPEGAERLGVSVVDDKSLGMILEIHALQDGAVLEAEEEAATLRFES